MTARRMGQQTQGRGVRAVVRRRWPLPSLVAGMGAWVLVVAVPDWIGLVHR